MMTALLSSSAYGKCEEDIVKCDSAVKALKEEVRLCDLAIQQSEDYGTLLNQQVKELESTLNKPWHNPWIVGALGVVVGVLIAK